MIGGGAGGAFGRRQSAPAGQNRAGAGAAPGLLAKAEQIDNYLGLPGLTGAAMLEAFAAHARSLGIEAEEGRVANLMPLGGRFLVNFGGDILDAGSLILACGVSKAPPVPGEAELLGRGVSYCATCDGMLYRGKPVVVWGLAPDAAHEANFLAGIGCPVTFVAAQRPPELNPAVAFVHGGVRQVLGTEHVEGVLLTGQTIPCEGGVHSAGFHCAGLASARPGHGKRLCDRGPADGHQPARRVCRRRHHRHTPTGGQGRGRRPDGRPQRRPLAGPAGLRPALSRLPSARRIPKFISKQGDHTMEQRNDYISWDEYFMGIALLTAMRSKDPNSQVGACIVSPENQKFSRWLQRHAHWLPR